MNLERVKLTRDKIEQDCAAVMASKFVRGPMSEGAFIAGGFARSVAHKILLDRERSVRDYLTPEREESFRGRALSPGDVDVFSPPHIDLTRFQDGDGGRSPGGFAQEIVEKLPIVERNFNSYMVQLVDDDRFRHPDVESCLSSFDLINSRYAIVSEGRDRWLVWDPEAIELDASRLIGIHGSDCPFLSWRIMKYLRARGCGNGLAPGSDDKLTEWLIRAATGTWPEYFKPRHKIGIKQHVQMLQKLNLMRVTDLAFFLGRWNDVVREDKYGPQYVVDWAGHKIGEVTVDLR